MSSWIKSHPFKMAGIVSFLLLSFGMAHHYILNTSHDWVGFLLWSPTLFAIPYGLASFSYLSERRKNK
jgi:hypothetical protein